MTMNLMATNPKNCYKLIHFRICAISGILLSVPDVLHYNIDGVSPSVFRFTSTPMETGPIDACVET